MIERFYTMNDETKVVYHSLEMPENPELIYVGQSNNPNIKMAFAFFMGQGKIKTGYTLRELPEEVTLS